jgi:DNA polymerase-4
LQAHFGKAGAYYYWISRGVDNREVRANRIRKSVGAENTFSSDLTDFDALAAELQPLIDKVWRHCEDKGSRGRTVTLKVKFNDFETITRSRSVPFAVSSRSDLERLSIALLQNEMPVPKPVRLLGVSLSSLQGEDGGRTATRPADLMARRMISISRTGSKDRRSSSSAGSPSSLHGTRVDAPAIYTKRNSIEA